MNHWNCKSCGANMYSAASHSDKSEVECIGCGEMIENKFWRGEDAGKADSIDGAISDGEGEG